jgi:hypothetical protein
VPTCAFTWRPDWLDWPSASQSLSPTVHGVARPLYDAAKRLRDDPTDMKADVALAEASAGVFAVDYLPELDDAHMAAVGRVTRRLLGALGADEALEDEIKHQAEVLCRLIAPSAGPDAVDEEARRALARLEEGARRTGREVGLPQSEVTPGGEMSGQGGALGGLATGAAEGTARSAVAGKAAQGGGGGEAGFDEELEEEAEEETGELVYELAEWLPGQRVELSMLLEGGSPAGGDVPRHGLMFRAQLVQLSLGAPGKRSLRAKVASRGTGAKVALS